MHLSITVVGAGAKRLSWLCGKHPDRFALFETRSGQVACAFTRNDDEAATLSQVPFVSEVAVDKLTPGGSVHGLGDARFSHGQFYADAILDVLKTAVTGRSRSAESKPDEPVDIIMDIDPLLCVVPLHDFLPSTAWSVDIQPYPLDEKFPEFGSRHASVTFRSHALLSDFLQATVVLLPVISGGARRHKEVDVATRFSAYASGWIKDHPMRTKIIGAHFGRSALREIVDRAVGPAAARGKEDRSTLVPAPSLHQQRHDFILGEVLKTGGSVLDIGCGEGKILAALRNRPGITSLTGIDPAMNRLYAAGRKLDFPRFRDGDTLDQASGNVRLMQGDGRYSETRIPAPDCVVLSG